MVPKIDSPLGMGECVLVCTTDECWGAVETVDACCVDREEGGDDGWDSGARVGGCSDWVSVVANGVSCDIMDAMDDMTSTRDEDTGGRVT